MPNLWSYSPPHAKRGLNAVRVYERVPGGPLYVEWYDRDGRHQKSLTTVAGATVRDKSLAMKIADRMATAQAEVRNAETAEKLLGIKRQRTLHELLKAYADAHPEWSTAHARDQELNRRYWERGLGSTTPLTKITPDVARAWANKTIADKSARTQEKRLRYLKDAFNYAVRQLKWITSEHDLAALKTPRVRSVSRAYSLDEVRRLLPASEKVDLRLAVMCYIAWVSGRRETAIRTLKTSAYARERGKGGEYGVLQFPGETDKARRSGKVYVSGRAKLLLEKLLESPRVQHTGYIFADEERDAPVGTDRMLRMLAAAEELAGVEHIKGRAFHAFKRRFATEALRVSSDAASLQSGTEAEMLAGRYRQDDPAPKQEIADHMMQLLEGA